LRHSARNFVDAEIAPVPRGRIGGARILLLKPAIFMNDSGQSVGEAMRYFKKGIEDVTIFHDELDLAPFKVKVRTGGGTAGYDGLRSDEANVGFLTRLSTL
jgi:PTH1 family peptidyl-tRNA hydrolase